MRHPLSQKFHDVLSEMGEIHDRKQADYGRPATESTAGDPFANVRAAENFGLPGWVGAAIRMGDKQRRIEAAARGQELQNETVEDSFIDMAVYAVIGLVLFREEQAAKSTPPIEHAGECYGQSIREFTEKMTGELVARAKAAAC